jgi:hypothetical protein
MAASVGALTVLGPLALAPSAVAEPPSSWPATDNPSAVVAVLFLGGTAALLFAVIFLLSYLPSMIRGQREASTQSWGDQPEWFGGPRKGASAAAEHTAGVGAEDSGHETGGASARW